MLSVGLGGSALGPNLKQIEIPILNHPIKTILVALHLKKLLKILTIIWLKVGTLLKK